MLLHGQSEPFSAELLASPFLGALTPCSDLFLEFGQELGVDLAEPIAGTLYMAFDRRLRDPKELSDPRHAISADERQQLPIFLPL